MARQVIIGGNWKMNLLPDQAAELIAGLAENLIIQGKLEVVVFPQAPMINMVKEWAAHSFIQVGAQNCSDKISGAYTGETSPQLLKNLGCNYCLAGHSERREIFKETDEQVARKAQALINMSITPVVCVGESLEEREADKHWAKIENQIKAVYNQLEKADWIKPVFAYEPIWAIGTGKTASPDQADEVHRFIRKIIKDSAGDVIADAAVIMYGGSVKAGNAPDLLTKPEIDGFLVGGASLKDEDFLGIISAFNG